MSTERESQWIVGFLCDGNGCGPCDHGDDGVVQSVLEPGVVSVRDHRDKPEELQKEIWLRWAGKDRAFDEETYRSGGEKAHSAGCNEWRDERQTKHRPATEEELNFRPRNFGERVGDVQEVEQQQDPGEPKADHRDRAVELGYSGAAELAALNADESDQHEHLQHNNRNEAEIGSNDRSN